MHKLYRNLYGSSEIVIEQSLHKSREKCGPFINAMIVQNVFYFFHEQFYSQEKHGSLLQEVPAFRDFRIRDPRYLVIWFLSIFRGFPGIS